METRTDNGTAGRRRHGVGALRQEAALGQWTDADGLKWTHRDTPESAAPDAISTSTWAWHRGPARTVGCCTEPPAESVHPLSCDA